MWAANPSFQWTINLLCHRNVRTSKAFADTVLSTLFHIPHIQFNNQMSCMSYFWQCWTPLHYFLSFAFCPWCLYCDLRFLYRQSNECKMWYMLWPFTFSNTGLSVGHSHLTCPDLTLQRRHRIWRRPAVTPLRTHGDRQVRQNRLTDIKTDLAGQSTGPLLTQRSVLTVAHSYGSPSSTQHTAVRANIQQQHETQVSTC